jgi:hypothetical protein
MPGIPAALVVRCPEFRPAKIKITIEHPQYGTMMSISSASQCCGNQLSNSLGIGVANLRIQPIALAALRTLCIPRGTEVFLRSSVWLFHFSGFGSEAHSASRRQRILRSGAKDKTFRPAGGEAKAVARGKPVRLSDRVLEAMADSFTAAAEQATERGNDRGAKKASRSPSRTRGHSSQVSEFACM